MPRQAARSAARGPLDKLRGPVRKMAEEVFSIDTDRSVLKDEPLMNGLSELQTKQALKVLETYCQNVQRQGSGRIQNKAAYLMSLIQSYKLGPSSGTPGSAQRLVERLSPSVRRAVEGVFDPVVDRVVLEDRALMELLAKVPEEQALAALKKYRATVQRRGRDAIDNRCGYLIGFLKQYQDGVAVVGVSNSGQGSRNGSSTISSNSDASTPKSANHSASINNGTASNGSRMSSVNGPSGGSTAVTAVTATAIGSTSQATAPGLVGNGVAGAVRPISYLQAPVRKQLEKLFESGKDKAVLEDVGLMKQLARLGEEQALAALKNYKEASKHRRDIHNKSAYLMGILRGYIEGTTPISKAPWESGGDDASEVGTASASAPPPASGASGGRSRNRGRGSGAVPDDGERVGTIPTPSNLQAAPQSQQPPPQSQPSVASIVPSLEVPGPREFGGFANAPAVSQPVPVMPTALPLPVASPPATSPITSSPLGGGLFLASVGIGNGVGDVPQQRFDPSNGLLYMDGSGSVVPGFSPHVAPPAHQPPPRHASPHESLFGNTHGSEGGPQALVGPGLLGGEFLSNGGGSDRGIVHAPSSAASKPSSPANPGLFGSGLLAGDELGSCSNGSFANVPASPGSASALGSASGLGSNSLSGAGSGTGSPLGSEGGHDQTLIPASATLVSNAELAAGSSRSCDGGDGERNVSDWPLSSPRSAEGRENANSESVGGMVDMLARLNLSKYVPVLAEAEVDMDALRLFGEDDLKDLGFPKGPRIKLLHEVQNLNLTPRA